jgi:hypothetical protein
MEGMKAPELGGAQPLGSDPVFLGGLLGNVVLIYFCDLTLYESYHPLASIVRWQREYGAAGLRAIVVHSRTFDATFDRVRIMDTLSRFELNVPVLADMTLRLAQRYGVHSLPSTFLLDQTGTVRHVHQGSGGGLEISREIERLIRGNPNQFSDVTITVTNKGVMK